MTVRAIEQKQSRRIRSSSDTGTEVDYVWRVSKTWDPDEAVAVLTATRPASVVDPIWGWTLVPSRANIESIGGGVWDAMITYIDSAAYDDMRQLNPGEGRFSFNTAGERLHIYLSRERVSQHVLVPYRLNNYGRLIDVDDATGAQGIEIMTRAMRFSIEFRHPRANITHAFRRLLGQLTATTNNAEFMTHPAGEVLYLGGNGSQGNKSDPQLIHEFIQAPNLMNEIFGAIAGVDVKGHEYASIYTSPYTFMWNGVQQTGRRVVQVDIHRIYESSDFSQIGVGTS